MAKTLLLQTLLAPACIMMLLLGLLTLEQVNHAHTTSAIHRLVGLRERLDRSFMYIQDRHNRMIRRAREATLETRAANAEVAMQWACEHYAQDFDRAVLDARKTLSVLARTHPDERLAADVARLQKQLDRMIATARQVNAGLDGLRIAHLSQNVDLIRTAERELDRADRAMDTLMMVADGMVRGAYSWQAQRMLAAPWAVPSFAWLLFIPAVAASLGLAWMPLRRLRRQIAAESAAPVPLWATHEELRLASHLGSVQREQADLRDALYTSQGELRKAQQRGRSIQHELALLRFYNENLVNSLRSAVVVTDTAGIVQSVNRTARELLGVGDTAVGAPIEALPLYTAASNRSATLADDIAGALRERHALRYEAVSYDTKHQRCLLDLNLAPYQDESGAARGLLWVADDVTEAVHTKHQLLLAERLATVGRLSAQVAHEIRNPLSAIGLNAELLEEEFVADLSVERGVEARQLLRAIAAEIERLTQVTETYLHLARLPRPHLRRVDINQLVRDMFVMLSEEMRAHAVSWDLMLAHPAPWVRGDPGQLRQALLNIVRNSREAMPSGGTLQILTQPADDGCVIAVADSGEGIRPDVLPRVFEPFYSTKTNGTGLGLSLTHQIVTEHGGTVVAAANQPRGTRIQIHIPHGLGIEDVTH